jgi:adenylyltransferase/sulfurtransferase
VDDDTVDVTNLQRQVVHAEADVGRPKVDSARDRVLAANPHVSVRTHPVRLTAANALEILGGYDVVLDGADNFATRYLVDDACALLGIPDVWGSILGFDAQAAVFWAVHGPTYRDLFPSPDPGSVPSCVDGGVLGALCATVGSVMATEAVKLVCGIGDPLVGRLLVLDALGATWRTVSVRPDPLRTPVTALADYEAFCGVPATTPVDPAADVEAKVLADLLAARPGPDLVLLDVREPHEHLAGAIPGSVNVPLALLEADPRALPAGRLVLYCRSGARSSRALTALRAAGRTDVVHLSGGMLAWVRDVEPHRPLP